MRLHPEIAVPLVGVRTRRLSLIPLARDDLDQLTMLCAHAELWEYEHRRGLTREESADYLDRQMKLWDEFGFGGCGVREAEVPNELIGIVGLAVPTSFEALLPAVTIGWRFSPASWGYGYATEAATALLGQAFDSMGLKRVGCVTHAANPRSIALAERLGMRRITVANEPGPTEDSPWLPFDVTPETWIAQQGRT